MQNHDVHSPGTVLWLTGLSGAGKTTIGRLVYLELKSRYSNIVFLDGDELREVFGHDHGHTLDDRRKAALRNARLCAMLAAQGIHVVCATISMFDECRALNRQKIKNYLEVYIEVPMEVLKKRDQKELYSRAEAGDVKNVIGIDLVPEFPKSPELVIRNDGSVPPGEQAKQIVALHKALQSKIDDI